MNKGGTPSGASIVSLSAEEVCAILITVRCRGLGEEVCDGSSDFGCLICGVGILVMINWSTIINSWDYA